MDLSIRKNIIENTIIPWTSSVERLKNLNNPSKNSLFTWIYKIQKTAPKNTIMAYGKVFNLISKSLNIFF